MLPYIHIFNLQIPMYGLMITIGVALGVLVAVYFPPQTGISREDRLYSSCYAGIGVFLGAKILYLIITVPQLLALEQPPALTWEYVSQLLSYGFVFYGGVLGGLLGIYIYARQFQLPFVGLTEALIPSVPLIHALGRIGCFCAGCCYGRPMDSPWGLHFHSGLAPQDITLFPVQLLESGLNLILFVAIFVFSRKSRQRGQILGFYFTFYGIERFVLEYFRYDDVRGIFLGLSTSQWISLLLLPIGIFLLLSPNRPRFFQNQR